MDQDKDIEPETDDQFWQRFKAWYKRDTWTIIMCLIVLIITVYAMGTMEDYQNQCNQHWIKQCPKCLNVGDEIDNLVNFTANYSIIGVNYENTNNS